MGVALAVLEPAEAGREVAPAAIELRDLGRAFSAGRKRQRIAVDHLTLRVPQGQVFGLLGPNGSGKTTTINMISGLIPPTSGSISILGMDLRRNRRRILQRIGTVPQETALYDELSAWTNMEFHADLYGVPGGQKRERITRLLDLVSLIDRKDHRVATFSGGMKRRLAIARALLHDPDLLILDEPTLGVDVQARAAIWEYIRELRRQRKTVLIATNYMEEAQALCDSLAIVDHGRLIAVDTPDHLRRMYGGSVVSVAIQVSDRTRPAGLPRLRALDGVTDVSVDLGEASDRFVVRIGTRGASNHLARIVNLLSRDGEIEDVSVRESNLEEVFLHLTGQVLRD